MGTLIKLILVFGLLFVLVQVWPGGRQLAEQWNLDRILPRKDSEEWQGSPAPPEFGEQDAKTDRTEPPDTASPLNSASGQSGADRSRSVKSPPSQFTMPASEDPEWDEEMQRLTELYGSLLDE